MIPLLLLKTWLHGIPVYTPASPWMFMIRSEENVEDICSTLYIKRRGSATSSSHQGRPIAVCDCHVIIPSVGTNIESSKF